MICPVEHYLAFRKVLSCRNVPANSRIDCKQDGFRFDAAKEQKFVLGWGQEITEEMKECSRNKGLPDELASLFSG